MKVYFFENMELITRAGLILGFIVVGITLRHPKWYIPLIGVTLIYFSAELNGFAKGYKDGWEGARKTFEGVLKEHAKTTR